MLKYPLVGSVTMWSTDDIPDGYLVADGSAVSRTTYADLFAVIGTQFGAGNGSTTFNLPDLRGHFPRFKDGLSARDPDRNTRTPRAGSTALNAGSKQTSEIGSHNHSWSWTIYQSSLPWFDTSIRQTATAAGWSASGTSNSGGAESRPKNITVAGLIKY